MQKLHSILVKAIANHIFPGCVLGIITPQKEHIVSPFGNFTYKPAASKVQKDSVYDIASLTKVIPTNFLALQLIDQGKLSISEQVIKYIPELIFKDAEKITIWNLLTHTLEHDFQLAALKHLSAQEILQTIFTTPLKSTPGSSFFYSNASTILLGLIIERIYSQSLDHIAQEHVFEPLEMFRTSFHPLEKFTKNEIVPTEDDPWRRRLLQGEVHDESAAVLQTTMTPGSAGLFSTAEDILHFLEMLLNGGNYAKQKLLSEKIIQKMFTNQLQSIQKFGGLGIDIFQPCYMGTLATVNTWGKTGYTGCFFVGDNTRQTAFVLLCNHVHPQRTLDRNILQRFRAELSNAVFNYFT